MERPKVGVVGWYNHRNCGDEAYRLSFPKLFPQYDFVFSEKPNDSIDTWVLGGGDVVNRKNLDALKGVKKKHILSATVSNPHDLSGFSTVAVRDALSLETAKNHGAGSVRFAPDFAFALEGDAARGRRIVKDHYKEDRTLELYEKVVVVVVNGYLCGEHSGLARNHTNFQSFAFQLAEMMDNTSASFLFVPFGARLPTDDRVANGWVASKCKYWQKNSVVFNPWGVQDTIDVIAGADAVISTRLHSSIFSCICGTPFLDITHNHKNERFLASIGWNDFSVDYRGFDPLRAKALLGRILTARGELGTELAKITKEQKNLLRQFADDVDLVR
jgi:polysaccharide pyruvyl transferase WcaK-like protein